MKKNIIILIVFCFLFGNPVFAEQFNRYQTGGQSNLNSFSTNKAEYIELLVDFSVSMSRVVEITKKTMEYIIPKLGNTKTALRLFGGDLNVSPTEQAKKMCTYEVRVPVKNPNADKCTSYKNKLDSIDCAQNPSNRRECNRLRALYKECEPALQYTYKTEQRPCTSISYSSSCFQSKLVARFGSTSSELLSGFNRGIIGGFTPIELGLKHAVKDLNNIRNKKKKIVLITDGYESCGGDPCSYIKSVLRNNKNITIDVIIIGDNDNLKCLSDSTGGNYYKVNDATLIDALEKTFDVPKGTADKVRKYKFVDFN